MRPSLSRVRTGLIPCVWSVCEGEGGSVCVEGRGGCVECVWSVCEGEGGKWERVCMCGVCVRGRVGVCGVCMGEGGRSRREFACVECVCVRYYSEYMYTFSEKPCSS